MWAAALSEMINRSENCLDRDLRCLLREKGKKENRCS
jgi:hypothetical protein